VPTLRKSRRVGQPVYSHHRKRLGQPPGTNPATRKLLLKVGLKVSGKFIAKSAGKFLIIGDLVEGGLAAKDAWSNYKGCIDHYTK
jgi:hypothetical protein